MITADWDRQQSKGKDTVWPEYEHGSTTQTILEFIILPTHITMMIIRLLEYFVFSPDEQTVYYTDTEVLSLFCDFKHKNITW